MTARERAYNLGLCKRLRKARKDAGLTQQRLADLVGVSLETYKKYETRSPLPPYLFPLVIEHTKVNIYLFVMGRLEVDRKAIRAPKAA